MELRAQAIQLVFLERLLVQTFLWKLARSCPPPLLPGLLEFVARKAQDLANEDVMTRLTSFGMTVRRVRPAPGARKGQAPGRPGHLLRAIDPDGGPGRD